MKQVGKRGWGDGLPAMRLDSPRWVDLGELSTGHELFADPSARTPEDICAENELRQVARHRLLLSGNLSRPMEAALHCFVAGGSMDKAREEYLLVQGIELADTFERLGRGVIAPFQLRA